jgi:hypothetical protein
VGGSGAAHLVTPDVVCVLWRWGGDTLPALVDGLSFRVDHAVVVPDTWATQPGPCATSDVPSCTGAVLTVDASTCSIGFVRSGTAARHAFVGVVGSLRCAASYGDCGTSARRVDAASDVSSRLDLEVLSHRRG